MRNTKILATLGPSSANPVTLAAMIRAGLDGVRLNFSHGTPDKHRENAALVRKVSAECGRTIAILGDLSGPKIRTGKFSGGPITLVEGSRFTLTHEPVDGTSERVSMTYPLANDLHEGDILLLDDGLLRLRVERVAPPALITVVEVGGELSDNKGINVPTAQLRTPAVTDKDRADIALAQELDVDYLAMSFVRTADDVRLCKSLAGNIPVIAKIEKPEAVTNLASIVEAADGIMVARGDLGVELGSEKVPLVQKSAIRLVNHAGKLVITATQMLDSMIRNPRPTRAEAADVANAVLDGTDVVMLSGESASGRYPVQSVQTMNAIIHEVEHSSFYAALPEPSWFGDQWTLPNACARAAASVSRQIPLAAIIVSSRTGLTANILADYRPRAPIFAITNTTRIAARLALQWGVRAIVNNDFFSYSHEECMHYAERIAIEQAEAKPGATVAIVLGSAQANGEKALSLRTVRAS